MLLRSLWCSNIYMKEPRSSYKLMGQKTLAPSATPATMPTIQSTGNLVKGWYVVLSVSLSLSVCLSQSPSLFLSLLFFFFFSSSSLPPSLWGDPIHSVLCLIIRVGHCWYLLQAGQGYSKESFSVHSSSQHGTDIASCSYGMFYRFLVRQAGSQRTNVPCPNWCNSWCGCCIGWHVPQVAGLCVHDW